MSLYLYALIAGPGEAPLGRGLAGEPLRALDCGGVVAIVGDMPRPPAIAAPALRAHHEAVRRIAAAAAAVLPVRFGSLADDEADLARRLTPRADALTAALARVAGAEQMTMRVYEAEAPAPAAAPAASVRGPGTRYLAERAQRKGHEALRAVRESIGPAVASLVRSERIESHGTPPLVATIHHLVERGQSERYASAAMRAAAGLTAVSVELRGPWPPYAFAAEATDPEASAPTTVTPESSDPGLSAAKVSA
jgi:hypothetical protein